MAKIADAKADRLVESCLPEFSSELVQGLMGLQEFALAASVSTLVVIERCACGAEFCAGFYTQSKPTGAFGLGHRNIQVGSEVGYIILDVVGDRIHFIEVLDRADVKRGLDRVVSV